MNLNLRIRLRMGGLLAPVIVVLVCVSIIGCESDPILAPSTEEEAAGSYGLSTFPGGGTEEDEKRTNRNPELF